MAPRHPLLPFCPTPPADLEPIVLAPWSLRGHDARPWSCTGAAPDTRRGCGVVHLARGTRCVADGGALWRPRFLLCDWVGRWQGCATHQLNLGRSARYRPPSARGRRSVRAAGHAAISTALGSGGRLRLSATKSSLRHSACGHVSCSMLAGSRGLTRPSGVGDSAWRPAAAQSRSANVAQSQGTNVDPTLTTFD